MNLLIKTKSYLSFILVRTEKLYNVWMVQWWQYLYFFHDTTLASWLDQLVFLVYLNRQFMLILARWLVQAAWSQSSLLYVRICPIPQNLADLDWIGLNVLDLIAVNVVTYFLKKFTINDSLFSPFLLLLEV